MATIERLSWSESFKLYLRRSQMPILITGIASGLPLLLTLSTLSYWLSKVGIDKTTIGLFALVGIPYTFKFAWSPIIDRLPLPFLSRELGRRRSWLFLTQIALAIAIFAMGQTDPAANPWNTVLAALIVAFLSASQDIAIDAYRIELLSSVEQGAGAGTTQIGYRIGMLLAGAGALALSDYVSWDIVFAALAAFMLVLAAGTLFIPEPAAQTLSAPPSRYRDTIKLAVVDPFRDFIGRRGWVVILAFVMFYKFGDAFSGTMAYPFYNEMGFSGTEIAAITKVYGLIATLLGGLIGGACVAHWGLFKTLLIGGILQALTNLLFSLLAMRGHDIYWLGIAITADNLAGGVAAAALVAYLSGLCNIAFTATQYALLTSFMAQGRTLLSTGSGWVADHMAWEVFWATSVLMAIPGLILLFWLFRLYPQGLIAERQAATPARA